LQKLVNHTGVVHEQVIIVTVITHHVPKIEPDERIELTMQGDGFYRLILNYGFMQRPNIPSELALCGELGLTLDLNKVHYFVGHVDLLAGRKRKGMVLWREKLFAIMAANTEDATAPYQLPLHQIMKVGLRVGI
jgi:KUP system potassium uptake protein